MCKCQDAERTKYLYLSFILITLPLTNQLLREGSKIIKRETMVVEHRLVKTKSLFRYEEIF